ncbi:hypothetical protein DESC_590094 [Desulfosarcina cetonica]|nr:hypothetical protein DESC_590094 [Desulfosarcina cetonica]
MQNGGDFGENFIQVVSGLNIPGLRRIHLARLDRPDVGEQRIHPRQGRLGGHPGIPGTIGEKDVGIFSAVEEAFDSDFDAGGAIHIVEQVIALGKPHQFSHPGVTGLHQHPLFIDVAPHHLGGRTTIGRTFADIEQGLVDPVEKGVGLLLTIEKRRQKLNEAHARVEAHGHRRGGNGAGDAQFVEHGNHGRVPGEYQFRLLLFEAFEIDAAGVTQIGDFTGRHSLFDVVGIPALGGRGDPHQGIVQNAQSAHDGHVKIPVGHHPLDRRAHDVDRDHIRGRRGIPGNQHQGAAGAVPDIGTPVRDPIDGKLTDLEKIAFFFVFGI